MNILEFTREKVKAMAQSGLMNIQAIKHWDICNELAKGKTEELVAEEMHIPHETLRSIKKKKCPCR